MNLHLGDDVIVPVGNIIAMLDAATALAGATEDFLKTAREEGFIRRIGEEEVKSVVLTERRGRCVVYFSPISTQTLLRRAGPGALGRQLAGK